MLNNVFLFTSYIYYLSFSFVSCIVLLTCGCLYDEIKFYIYCWRIICTLALMHYIYRTLFRHKDSHMLITRYKKRKKMRKKNMVNINIVQHLVHYTNNAPLSHSLTNDKVLSSRLICWWIGSVADKPEGYTLQYGSSSRKTVLHREEQRNIGHQYGAKTIQYDTGSWILSESTWN